MRPTGIVNSTKPLYSQMKGFFKFRWFFASLLLGSLSSWLIKDAVTPILMWGKSFDERSLLFQIGILALYVLFTSVIFFFVLVSGALVLMGWSETPLYGRVSGQLRRLPTYFSVSSRGSGAKDADESRNIIEPAHPNDPLVVPDRKTEPFVLADWLKSYWIYVVIYAFFLYVSFTTARAGDDWEVSNWYQNGALSTLAGMIRAITYINGRVAALFFDSFFANYPFLWCLTAPALFTSIIYLSARLFGYARNPVVVGVGFFLLLSVSDAMRIETYVWLIGNVAYIPVSALMLLYLNIIYSENTDQRLRFWHNEKLNYLIVALLAFVTGLWVENVTAGFVAANILLAVLFYIKNRRISTYISYGILGSIMSCFVIFGSLFLIGRSQGLSVGLGQRISQNLPGILQKLVVENLSIYLAFLLIFIVLAATGTICSSSRTLRVASTITASAMAMIISTKMSLQFAYGRLLLPVGGTLEFVNGIFFDVTKLPAMVFCLALLFFILIAVFLLPQKEKPLVLYCIAMVSTGFMLAAPYLGARIFVPAIAMLISITAYMASIVVIKSTDLRKAAVLVLVVATLLQVEKFYYYGEYVRQVETIRLQLMDSYRARAAAGLTSEKELLVLPGYKADAVYATANPGFGNFYMAPFKRYYNLPPDTNLIIDDGFAVKDFTAVQVAGLSYRFEVTPLHDTKYTYTFVVKRNGSVVFQSAAETNNFYLYTFPGRGIYNVSCILIDGSGTAHKEVNIFSPIEVKGK